MKTLFNRINEARKILKLPESATMEEIKRNYRRLLKNWHPDLRPEEKEIRHKMTKRINSAYRILMDYCQHYQFSFKENEVNKYISPEEWWLKRFGHDPAWGKTNPR